MKASLLRAAALTTALAAAVVAQAAPPQPTAQRVTAHVVVTEDGTTPVLDPAINLIVRSDGIFVPVVAVVPAPPLSVVLVMDVTISMSEAMASFVWDGRGRLDDVSPSGVKPADSPSALLLAPVLRGWVRHVMPGDRVRVGRIARQPELGPDFTSDRRALERAVRWALDVPRDERHSETPIWDALEVAIYSLEREAGRRRAIVLMTDGLSTGNRLSLDRVIERATRADVAVFVIAEAWKLRSPRGYASRPPWVLMSGAFERTPWSQLRRLASSTGGVLVPDGDEAWPDPEKRLSTVMSLLRASIAITFESPLLPGETGTLTIDAGDTRGREAHVKQRYGVDVQ